MDKIKHAARSNAWYGNFQDGDQGPKTYNFFGRVRAGQKRRDLENQDGNRLTVVQSETDAPSPIEARRRGDAEMENARFAAPRHHNTAPNADNASFSSQRGDISSTEKPTSEDTDKAALALKTANNEGIVDSAVSTNGQSGKPRRRRFHIFKSKDTDRADSNDTTENDDDKNKPKRVHNPNITVISQLKVVFLSWINILLVCVPIGIAVGNIDGFNSIAKFVINFVAIIPLAAILSYATEELALYIGETLGGLLNASFGNAVELIVGVIALADGQILIVQTSLIGSMLSNLLLVLGMCFFCGGINRVEQNFNLTVAQTAASLLALAIGSLIIPTAFQIFEPQSTDGVTPVSRGTAVLLLVVYVCYLIFQLRTHVDIYNEPSEKVAKKSSGKKDVGEALKGLATIGAASGAATAGGKINQENLVQDIPEEEELPQLSIVGALLTLTGSTVFVALCADYMVDAIDAISGPGTGLSQEFVGLILLPIVGNAAEHATAVTVAIKDKMDLAIGVAIGSSLQIALLVLPLMILLNWFGVGAPQDLTLNFDGWLVVVLVISIWLVNYLINDGKSHWLEGVMLMITYLIIAVSAWFYPTPEGADVAG